MSYLGQVELKSSEIRRIDVTGSTSATHTLTWTPPSEQSLIITINGVKQQNNYSFSGTTLTLDTALIVTDAMEVIGILDIGEAVTPPDDSISTIKIQDDAVTTAKINDDAVTAAKLANSINTEIAANTAKVTNATHTGDVTGATALTIATDAVDIAMLSATGVASATTFLRGDNAWVAIATPDNTPSFDVYLNANQTVADATFTKIEFNVENWDTDSAFDNSTNYRFTVPVGEAGKYAFFFKTRLMTSPGANYQAGIRLSINGTGYAPFIVWDYTEAASRDLLMSGSGAANLADSDYVEAFVYNGFGGSTTISGGSPFSDAETRFSGFKLSGV